MLSHTLHRAALLPLPPRHGRPVVPQHHRFTHGTCRAYCLLQVADVSTTARRGKILTANAKNARYDAVVDSAPDAIVTVDAEGVIQWVEQGRRAPVSATHPSRSSAARSRLSLAMTAWSATLSRLLQGVALTRPIEITGKHKDGRSVDLEFSASALG